MAKSENKKEHTKCPFNMLYVRDSLDVINGKWKMMILISLMNGNRRFTEIERSIPKITSKVLAKELKDLEENQLITRMVHDSYPVLVEYSTTAYVKTLDKVLRELHNWGINHRKKIFGK